MRVKEIALKNLIKVGAAGFVLTDGIGGISMKLHQNGVVVEETRNKVGSNVKTTQLVPFDNINYVLFYEDDPVEVEKVKRGSKTL